MRRRITSFLDDHVILRPQRRCKVTNWKRLFMCVNKYCFFPSIDRRKMFCFFPMVVMSMIFLSLQFYHWSHSRQASNTWYCRNLIRIVNIVAIKKKCSENSLTFELAQFLHSYLLLSHAIPVILILLKTCK